MKTKKPRPKVTAAGLTPLVAAVFVFLLDLIGVDIPDEVALSLAGAAVLAFGGGWLKSDDPVPAPVIQPVTD